MSIDLSLDRISALLTHLPPYTRPTCHIAGTNGKGSVASLLSSILLASSPPLSVGRFNSPHLSSIYDCITLDNAPVSPAAYAAARAEVERADAAHGTGASSFELLTATALCLFERAGVDVAVVEVGMGGRRDATNALPAETVLVAALTAVDLDHQAFLGDTVEEIAREKAGIARAGRPFVLGPQAHQGVEGAVEEVVGEAGAVLVRAARAEAREWDEALDGPRPPSVSFSDEDFSAPAPQPVRLHMHSFSTPVDALLPLYGQHQLDNLGTVAGVVDALLQHPAHDRFPSLRLAERLSPQSIAAGIRTTTWAGRLSFHTITISSPSGKPGETAPRRVIVLADGAHNPASAVTLGRYISELQSSLGSGPLRKRLHVTYILALSHSPPKTPLQTLMPLFSPDLLADERTRVDAAVLRFTPPEGMPWVKSVPPSELAAVIRVLATEAEVWCTPEEGGPNLEDTLRWAAERQAVGDVEEESLIVLAGSLYLVADFYRLLTEASL